MLHPGPEFVVRAFLNAWTLQDVEHALTYMSDDVEWFMYIDQETIQFAGYSRGVDAMRQRMAELRRNWEMLSFDFDTISLVGQTARVLQFAEFRHIATGRVLDLKIRGVFTVVGKKIVRCDEYHDEARIRAFMAMVNAESAAPPS